MSPPLVVFWYALLTLIASLLGGWIPLLLRMTHARTQLMMSLVAGLMLGVGVFHMLPHAAADGLLSLDRAVWWMMVGLLFMFFLQRFFHFHQHEAPEVLTGGDQAADHLRQVDHVHGDHSHAVGHRHGDECPHEDAASRRSLNWAAVAIGLTLHTLLDGVALAASVEAEAELHGHVGWLGVGTFAAVFLHKPLDAMAVTSMMRRGGWSAKSHHLVNGAFALMCPVGAGLFYAGMHRLGGDQQIAVNCALAFSAGVFVCISLADLLPEVQFHSHDRVKLSVALLVGVSLAYGIVFFEGQHLHGGSGVLKSSKPSINENPMHP